MRLASIWASASIGLPPSISDASFFMASMLSQLVLYIYWLRLVLLLNGTADLTAARAGSNGRSGDRGR